MNTIIVVAILLGVILLAGIGCVVYFFIYKSNVNKALSEDDNTHPKKLPSPGRTLTSVAVCIVSIAVLLNSVSLVVVNLTLKEEEKRLVNEITDLNRSISDIENEVSHLTENVNNTYDFFYSVSFEPNEWNPEEKTFKMNVTVDPKIISESEITGGFGYDTVVFSKNDNGTYTGIVSYRYLQDVDEVQTFCIHQKTGDITFEEKISVPDGMITEKFFSFIDDYSHFVFTSSKDGILVNGEVSFDVYTAEFSIGHAFKTVSLIIVMNEQEVYHETIESNKSSEFSYYSDFEKTLSGNPEDEIEVYLKFERDDGFSFEVPCTYICYENDGLSSHGKIYSGNLIDKNGNLKTVGRHDNQTIKRIYLPSGERLK